MCITSFPWETRFFLCLSVLWAALLKTQVCSIISCCFTSDMIALLTLPWCFLLHQHSISLLFSSFFELFIVQSVFVQVQRQILRDGLSLILEDFNCLCWTVIDSVFFPLHPTFLLLWIEPVFLFTSSEHCWPCVSESYFKLNLRQWHD